MRVRERTNVGGCAYVRVRECVRSSAHVQKDVMGQVTILGSPVPGSCMRETWCLGCVLRVCVCVCECVRACERMCAWVRACVRGCARVRVTIERSTVLATPLGTVSVRVRTGAHGCGWVRLRACT